MTIIEFFKAIEAAPAAEREALAENLLKELDPDERELAEFQVYEFIASLGETPMDD
jgi:hypothetical protein